MRNIEKKWYMYGHLVLSEATNLRSQLIGDHKRKEIFQTLREGIEAGESY